MEIFPRSGGVHEPFEFVAQGHPWCAVLLSRRRGRKGGPKAARPGAGLSLSESRAQTRRHCSGTCADLEVCYLIGPD